MNRELTESITKVIEFNEEKSAIILIWLRNKGRTVNALALGADEGRDEQRYASGSGKYAKIRRFPNGETQWL